MYLFHIFQDASGELMIREGTGWVEERLLGTHSFIWDEANIESFQLKFLKCRQWTCSCLCFPALCCSCVCCLLGMTAFQMVEQSFPQIQSVTQCYGRVSSVLWACPMAQEHLLSFSRKTDSGKPGTLHPHTSPRNLLGRCSENRGFSACSCTFRH